MTTARAAREDTFPKLIVRNGRIRPTRTAFRHKDLGIWQSWTWSEVHESVRAYAAGLKALGLRRGGKIAVIGQNRPRMYWTMAAAQWLGAVPIPVYADSVAEEMAYRARPRRGHARGGSGSGAGRQDPVGGRPGAAPHPSPLRRGARPARLRPFEASVPISEVIDEGRKRLADADEARALDAELEAGRGEDLAIILYTSGTTGPARRA